MSVDLHKSAFDEGTKVKLSLYRDYLEEWLPVFLASEYPYCDTINIFDFFAGPGKDINDCQGSPLIALDLLSPYLDKIIQHSVHVKLFFNEKSKRKLQQLKAVITEQGHEPLDIEFSHDDFQVAFNKFYRLMQGKKTANFLFLDQSGIKQITSDIFHKMISLPRTDFLFFISSATFNRFADLPDIKKYLEIPTEKISNSNYLDIHRIVLDHYRSLIPKDVDYHLAPFSIKKGRNIYGLIYGSGNILGLEKFLRRCWKIDPQRGEANFDIDDDRIDPHRPKLFPEMNIPKKIQLFEKEMRQQLMNKAFKTNKDIFIYTLTNGFLPDHARKIIRDLITESVLPKQKLNVSYNSCIKKKDIQNIYW